jgi:hypothetical protein
MDITTAQSILAVAQSQRVSKYAYNTQPDYTPGTTIEQYNFTKLLSTQSTVEGAPVIYNPQYIGLCNTLDVPTGTPISISSILGDLTMHTDGWAIPQRLLWLLSPNSVSVSMGGIDAVYTTGDCCVLNTRKPHSFALVEGEYPQVWVIAEVPMDQIPLSVWASVPNEHAVFKDLYYGNI